MSTANHERVRALLEQAVDQPTAEQTAFIRAHATGDTTLEVEALDLLAHYRRLAGFEPPAPAPEVHAAPTAELIAMAAAADDANATTQHPVAAAADVADKSATIASAPGELADPPFVLSGEAARRLSVRIDQAPPQPPFCLDQYRVEEIIGQGGMGVVYRAVHATQHCAVALKLMHAQRTYPELTNRFALEVEILRQLRHPNIAWLVHSGSAPLRCPTSLGVEYRQTPFFVMEYVDGAPLHVYVRQKQLGLRAKLELLCQVCSAVDFAHRRGVIHRDLKPDNILVTADGVAKILDFGVARLSDVVGSLLPDERGRFIGTPRYASPEQLAGRGDALTTRSDVFSLGLIAHELLCGALPAWRGRRIELSKRPWAELSHDSDQLSCPPREFEYHIRELLTAALQIEPDARLDAAGRMAERLEEILARAFRPPRRTWTQYFFSLFGAPSPAERSIFHRGENPALRAVLQARIRLGLEGGKAETPLSPDHQNRP
jgi:serine/threonine protein kinase